MAGSRYGSISVRGSSCSSRLLLLLIRELAAGALFRRGTLLTLICREWTLNVAKWIRVPEDIMGLTHRQIEKLAPLNEDYF